MEALRRAVTKVADALVQRYGRPRSDVYEPPLDALVRTVLSQHTSDRNSDRAFERLRAKFSRWDQVREAPLRAIESAVRCAGLWRQKARRIRAILRVVHRTYGRAGLRALNRLSNEEAARALRSLPGVGAKTAACVLLFGFRRDVFPVDTHIHRICRRLGWVPSRSTAEEAAELMQPLVPRGRSLELHIAMIRHGREICRARRPRCDECCVRVDCAYAWASEGLGR
jgi:endonuclease-3